MISVIVPYAEDNTYLIRCINSMLRQNYKNIEILVIAVPDDLSDELKERDDITFIKKEGDSPYAGVNEALQKSTGDYIFFCDMTSVPAPNTLSTLLEYTDNNQEVLFGGAFYLPSENGFDISSSAWMSWFGKLFRKDILIKGQVSVNENSVLPEFLFFVENLIYYENYNEIPDIYIYEMEVFSKNIGTDVNESADWDSLLLGLSKLDKSAFPKMLQELTQYIQDHNIVSENLLWAAGKNLHDCYGLNYMAAEPLLKLWWASIENDRDAEALQQLRQYLQQYEAEEDFFDLLLKVIGLNRKQYSFLSYENPNDTMLLLVQNAYEDNREESSVKDILLSMQRDFNELKENVASLQTNINDSIVSQETESYEVMQQSNQAISEIREDSHILELEDHIINQCRNGNVGLRTIMKFFRGWMSFKFHGGDTK